MKKIKIAGHDVEIYDSIEELPIMRFHKYNKMVLFDAGIGSTIEQFDARLKKATVYASRKDFQNMVKELENLRQCVHMVQNEVSPGFLSFAVMVQSIDGRPCDDLSEDGLNNVVSMLYEASVGDIHKHLDGIKKKIDTELKYYFPSLFDDAKTKEYYDELNKRTQCVLQQIITGESRCQEVQAITDTLMTFYSPQVFNGPKSVELGYDRKFCDMCLIIQEKTHADPKRMSVLEFYNAFEYIKNEAKARNNANKRI